MFYYSDGCDKDQSDENYHPKFNLQRFKSNNSKNEDAGSSVEAFGSEEALAHETALDISEESSWQETEVSSSTKIGAEVNKDGTITEEEEVETIPSTGYSVTGSGEDDHRMSIDDPRRMSIVSLEDEDSMGLTNIKDLASQSSDENSGVRITDYNTETYEHEADASKTKGRITTIGGEKEYSTTEEDGSKTQSKVTVKASVEEEVTVIKSGGDMPTIEVSGEEDEDQPSSSYSKTTSSWGGEEEEESEDGTRTKKKTSTTTTTTTTEETQSSRTLKQKASIDTHDHEIIIYNKDGIEITRVTHGDVIVGFDKVDEVVMVKNGLLTVSHESGECLVRIVDGEKHGTERTEVNVFEFDGEVIVRSLVDVAHKYLVPKKSERKLSIHDINAAADDE